MIRWLAPPNHRSIAELSALFLMFSPVTLYVIQSAWTEPLVLVFWLGVLLTTRKVIERNAKNPDDRSQLWIAVTLGFLAVIKQYSVLVLLPPLLLAVQGRRRWRLALLASLVAAAICLPFFIWQPAEFISDVVLTQFRQPFRLDSQSLLAVIARLRSVRALPNYTLLPAFLAPVVVFALNRPSPGRLDQISRVTSAAFLLFIFLNKQAFCNYYWLALGLLCASCASVSSSENAAALATEGSRAGN